MACPATAQSVAWTQQNVSGPSPRYQYAMAYDAARGVIVLFGGSSGAGQFGDTWEWNGAGAWTQRSVNGPSPRFLHAMAYDAARGVSVLFGGLGMDYSGQTWEWNGAGAGAWTQRAASGPSPRIGSAMCYD